MVALTLGIQVALVYFLVRNELVYREKNRVLDIVVELAIKDPTDAWRWRFDAYSEIPYYVMMLKFWKPVKSFYENHRCLKK